MIRSPKNIPQLCIYCTLTPPQTALECTTLHLHSYWHLIFCSDSLVVPASTTSHLPQVSLQNLLHTSAGTKRNHTPLSTMTTMTPPSTMTNIQGDGLPSPSHNVLTNPPEPYKVKAHNGIVESAKKWYIQLDLTSYQPDITTFRYEGANSTRWGNRPNEALTKKRAETMYKQLWNFIMMYGDYDSLLILLSPPPNNVISMTAKSIELILLYKHQKQGHHFWTHQLKSQL